MEVLTLEEIRERFGRSTERRQDLLARFEEWLDAARSTGALRRVWIYGSYISGKTDPADVDVVAMFSRGFEPEELPFETRNWFRQELLYGALEIDLYFFTESMPVEMVSGLLEWFERGRGEDGGMMEVEL